MSDAKPIKPLSLKLPEDFFSMSEKEQRAWVADYLKRSIGKDYASAPNKDQEN
jgi:hypothetical protein